MFVTLDLLNIYKLCSKFSDTNQSLTETERPLNISLSLSTAFAVEAHRAEGQFRRLQSTLNKLKSLNFRFCTRRQKFSKSVGQYFEPLKILFKNDI